jgi:hypothetical protein
MTGWARIVAVACVVAALIAAVRLWPRVPTFDAARRGEVGAGAEERRAGRNARDLPGGMRAGRTPEAAGGARGGASGGSRPGNNVGRTGGLPTRQLLGNDRIAAAGDRAGAPNGPPDGTERSLDAPVTRRDLPVGDRAQPPEDVDQAEPEPMSEVVYDGGPDHVFDTGSQVTVADAGPVSGAAGTIAFWIEPQWQANNQDGASFVRLGEHGLELIKDGNLLRFEYTDTLGAEHGGSADISAWQAGDRRHVAATWNGSTLSLYIDGAQMFLNTPPNAPNFTPGTQLFVGSDAPEDSPVAPGRLSYLTVLNRDASADEIRQMFGGGSAGQ